ncbi:GNAT family N-acetyltransferase [Planctobacterium marinum]|uniref:GNAT family N-acetyltransferase n=1 Tax=Planctobacterium marinum TaxID=1631968 RepID=UPI0030C74A66
MSASIPPVSGAPGKSDTLIFRSFNPELCEELRSWFTTPQQIVFWSGLKFGFPDSVIQFRAQLKLAQIPAYALLSEEENQLLGFGQMMYDNGRCHFVRVATNPTRRGQGYGKKLLACLLAQGQRKFNPQFFSLFVNQSNQVAINLYRAVGFKHTQYPGPMPNTQSWYLEKPAGSL